MNTYSPLQTRILNAIPDDGSKISSVHLIGLVYDDPPLSARQSVLDSAMKLIAKVDRNVEPFEIHSSKSRGPQPIYFWKEPRTINKSIDLFTS